MICILHRIVRVYRHWESYFKFLVRQGKSYRVVMENWNLMIVLEFSLYGVVVWWLGVWWKMVECENRKFIKKIYAMVKHFGKF